MKTLTRISDGIAEWSGNISITFAVIMTVVVVGNVLTRDILGKPILGSYEIVEFSKGICVFFAFAYAQKRRSFIHVVMLIRKLPRRLGHLCFAIGTLVSTGVAVLVSIAAFQYGEALTSSGSVSGVLLIPYAPFAYIEGVAWSLFTLVLLLECVKAFFAIQNPSYAEYIESNWA